MPDSPQVPERSPLPGQSDHPLPRRMMLCRLPAHTAPEYAFQRFRSDSVRGFRPVVLRLPSSPAKHADRYEVPF